MMEDVNPAVVEKYQKLYAADPNSQVFAPLAEAYRKMGMLNEALDVARDGVKRHPHFAGGRVALAKVFYSQELWDDAIAEFKKVIELSAENVLAHSLLAECYLRLKRPKDALKSYKMLLFLSPENDKAQKAIKKLESLTADEYEDDVFALKPLRVAVKEWDEIHLDDPEENRAQHELRVLDRMISLADAYIVRGDTDRAVEALNEAERMFGARPEIVKRLKLLHQKNLDTIHYPRTREDLVPVATRKSQQVDEQIMLLKGLLRKLKPSAGR
jgi:tetratricopeptide (TPR) repeat protein